MLSGRIQDRAADYVSGAMAAAERESFEVVLEFHAALRAHVAALQEAVTALTMAQVRPVLPPPGALKARLFSAIEALPPSEPDALVVTDPDGRVEWVNPAFTAMCGYGLEELKGRKPGSLLQGPATDVAAVQRIRESIEARRTCRETLVNYHKDGSTYRVSVHLSPVLDDEGQPLWLVAREQRLAGAEDRPAHLPAGSALPGR